MTILLWVSESLAGLALLVSVIALWHSVATAKETHQREDRRDKVAERERKQDKREQSILRLAKENCGDAKAAIMSAHGTLQFAEAKKSQLGEAFYLSETNDPIDAVCKKHPGLEAARIPYIERLRDFQGNRQEWKSALTEAVLDWYTEEYYKALKAAVERAMLEAKNAPEFQSIKPEDLFHRFFSGIEAIVQDHISAHANVS